MKNYEAPEAKVVDFENDYVVALISPKDKEPPVTSPGLGDLLKG